MLFSTGQLAFAVVFAIVFIGFMIWSYRKDIKLHQFYYKNVWIVALGIFLTVAFFAFLTFWLHK